MIACIVYVNSNEELKICCYTSYRSEGHTAHHSLSADIVKLPSFRHNPTVRMYYL